MCSGGADDFVAVFENWARPHAAKFGPNASMQSEQKLEFMELYKVGPLTHAGI